MPLGRPSSTSSHSRKVVHFQVMPASMASAEMSSARSRLRTTRALSFSAQGASVKPQLPITTVVMPCQHEDVPSGSQKICASMCVWPSTKPGVTTWPSASITSRARSRIRPMVVMRPCRTPTSARYRGSPDPSMTVPFLITRSYDILGSPRSGSVTRSDFASSDFELIDSPQRRHRFGSYYRWRLASAEAPLRLVLPLALCPVGDLDRLLLGVEA